MGICTFNGCHNSTRGDVEEIQYCAFNIYNNTAYIRATLVNLEWEGSEIKTITHMQIM